jgi:hypothetical protein
MIVRSYGRTQWQRKYTPCIILTLLAMTLSCDERWRCDELRRRISDGEWFSKAGADSPESFLAYHVFDHTPDHGRKRKPWSAHILNMFQVTRHKQMARVSESLALSIICLDKV